VSDDSTTTQALEIDTWLLCRELHDGENWTAQAVADPRLVSFGSEAHVLADFETFLSEYLLAQPPGLVARFGLPDGVELRLVTVTLRRTDLPARLQIDLPVTFPCVLVPHGKDHWVMLPTLDHTFYLPRGEELEPATRSEVSRIVAAHELGEEGLLDLLPAAAHELRTLRLSLRHGGEGLAGHAAAVRKTKLEEHRRKEAVELLESVAVPLHARVGSDGPSLVGRDAELEQLGRLLAGQERTSVVVTGEPACGKSELIRAWLRPRREERLVYSTSAAELVAGMSGFGEWEERVVKVMRAAELLDAVLYFENLSELLSDHPERGGIDIAGVMRRWIVEGRVRLLGELGPEALAMAQRRQAALFGSIHRLDLEPLSKEQSAAALRAQIAHWNASDPRLPRVERALVGPVIELTDRYVPYRAFPGKAIRFVEELRAARVPSSHAGGEPPSISAEDAYDAFATTSGIPGFLLREDRALLAQDVVDAFSHSMVGQEEAVRHVVDTLCVVKAQLQPAGRPLATFLFVGPTGVGKTELARTLATFLFGSADRMARFDMSEYADPWAAERLIRGTAQEEGVLTSRVRMQPFCVLLLDEIEKAHPAVFDLLLQVCGEGRLTDARGKTTYLHNAIIIMTSNLGVAHGGKPIGVAASAASDDERYLRAVQQAFRPELVNRLDRIVPFQPLTNEQVELVARILIGKLEARRGLVDAGVTLDVSGGAVAELAREGRSETYGVRALRRHLDRQLVTPAAHLLARFGAEAKGCLLWVGVDGEHASSPEKRRLAREEVGDLRLELYQRPASASRTALHGVLGVADMRRVVDRMMAMDEAIRVKEERSFIQAQLATPKKGRKTETDSADLQRLHVRLHRLSEAWDAADRARKDIHAAEELALSALLTNEEARSWVNETRETFNAFRRRFFSLLSAHLERRDEITLLAIEPDGGRPMTIWLGSLLKECVRRQWHVRGHVREVASGDAAWPKGRPWGPPRDADWLADQIVGRGAHNLVMLRVRGQDAAVLLALETGLHRFRKLTPDDKLHHLLVSTLLLRADLTEEEWLWEPTWPSRPSRAELAIRERSRGDERILIGGAKREIALADDRYWRDFEELALEHLLLAISNDTAHTLYHESLRVKAGG
jgi:ATP-dependent Clp protease ATP-binding subunit ClpC